MWGDRPSGIVNPFACYICEPLTLNSKDTLHIDSDINATEIVSVNFWLPWTPRYQWKIDHIPREIFKRFRNLKKLLLPGQIQSISADDFVDATHLEDVELSNGIKSIPDSVFVHSPKLRRVNLSRNKIQRIASNAFANVGNLQYLHLDYNRLTGVDASMFRGIRHLAVLTLSNNKIERIDDGALDLPELREIDLSNNKLRTMSNMTLSRCIHLQHIQLKANELQSIGQTLYRLSHLRHVNMDRNHIVDIRLDSFAHLEHLEHLSMQYNGRQKFDALADVDVDVDATATNSDVSNVKNVPSKSSIRELFLAGNELKNPQILRYLRHIGVTQLETLDVDCNAYERIDVDVMDDFPRLRQINLGRNRWNCEWLNGTIQRFENENRNINLFSSHFPMADNETHINYIQCVAGQ